MVDTVRDGHQGQPVGVLDRRQRRWEVGPDHTHEVEHDQAVEVVLDHIDEKKVVGLDHTGEREGVGLDRTVASSGW